MGERLGRYLVLKHLASGGMADVLLARADGIEKFERHVVLKRIRAEHAKDQRFIEMFLDEARLAANLHHQNIVQVHDIGESDGEYFFAMEYLHGEDLRAMLSVISKTRAQMPLGTAVSVASAVAAGLHYAHEREIVHRDVSPSNILVGYDGSVKIVDFGIAKAAMRQAETRSGSVKGKVSYMSPEQCKLGTVDRRSDVYSLGVVLYELVTSTRLFKSESDYLVMDAICTGKIPVPRLRRPDLPAELSTIIMKALATDPDSRYQTADALRSALAGFASSTGLTASASTIGAYVQKLCGEKAEPWLASAASAPAAAASSQLRATPTTTSSKLGWETSVPATPARGFRPTKVAMLALPLLVVVGLLAWKLASTTESPTAAVTVASGVGSAMVAAKPAPTTPATVTATTAVKPATSVPPTGTKPAPVTTTGTKPASPPHATAPAKPGPRPAMVTPANTAAKPATTPTTPRTPGRATIAATTGPPESTPVDPPAPIAPAAPAVAPAMATLAPGIVEGLASKNRKALLACEGAETLKGELTVRFQIDGDGRVVKTALHSTLGKPTVAGCILGALKSWRFPKQATGSASGVYTISFQ